MIVTACGIPRSGSTLVWQILTRVFPNKQILKRHPGGWAPDGSFAFGSIRDPYDCAASRFRARVIGDKGDGSQETVAGTKAGLVQELRNMKHNFGALEGWMAACDHVVLKYEDFFNNFDVVFAAIEKHLSRKVTSEMRKQIEDDCSLARNRQRSYAPRDPKVYKTTLINSAHVGYGVPDTWKIVIPRWGYAILKQYCEPLCLKWGYPCNRL